MSSADTNGAGGASAAAAIPMSTAFPIPVLGFSPSSIELMKPLGYQGNKGMYVALKAAHGFEGRPEWRIGASTRKIKDSVTGDVSEVPAPLYVAFPPRPTVENGKARLDAGAKLAAVFNLSEQDSMAIKFLLYGLTNEVHKHRARLFPVAHAAMLETAKANVAAIVRLTNGAISTEQQAEMIERASMQLTQEALKKNGPWKQGAIRPPTEGGDVAAAAAAVAVDASKPEPERYSDSLRVSMCGWAPSVISDSIVLNKSGYVDKLSFFPTILHGDGSTSPRIHRGDNASEPTRFIFGLGTVLNAKTGLPEVVVMPSVDYTGGGFKRAAGQHGAFGSMPQRVPGPIDLVKGAQAEVEFRIMLHVTDPVNLTANWTITATNVVVWRRPERTQRPLASRYLLASTAEMASAMLGLPYTSGGLPQEPAGAGAAADEDAAYAEAEAAAAASNAASAAAAAADSHEEDQAAFDAVSAVEDAIKRARRGV